MRTICATAAALVYKLMRNFQIITLLSIYLGLSSSQNPAPSPPPNNQTNQTNRPPACNPFIQECPNADCLGNQQTIGRILVTKPGKQSYAFAKIPINVAWDYTSDTDNKTFPVNGFTLYYRKFGEDDSKWSRIGDVGKGNSSYLWKPQFELTKDTSYELLILADNIGTPGGRFGNQPSCYAPGFPIGKFLVL